MQCTRTNIRRPATYFVLLFVLIIVVISFSSKKEPERIANQKCHFAFYNNGLFVSADQHLQNTLICNRTEPDSWESFILLETNGKYCIQSSDGRYWVSGKKKGKSVKADAVKRSDSTTFVLNEVQPGRYSLKDFAGNYISIDPTGLIITDTQAVMFDLIIVKPRNSINKITVAEKMLNCLFLVLVVLSCFLFSKGRISAALWVLILASFCFHLYLNLINDQIQPWDEQFHFLVAKNLIKDPLKPMLFRLTVDLPRIITWDYSEIWLHKPPLFLWLMAASMKLFGTTVFAARIPTLLMISILPILIFRSAEIVFRSKQSGYLAVLFSCCSYYISLLSVGSFATDHNDIAFIFFVSTSLWAWFEYYNSESERIWPWLLIIGVSSGFAVLTKLFAGFLVFGGWGMTILLSKSKRLEPSSYSHLLITFFLAVLVFLPWNVYAWLQYPHEYFTELKHASSHFGKVIEGHGGDFMYYLDNFYMIYRIPWFIFGITLLVLSYQNRNTVFLLSVILAVVIFYSAAATKMAGFVLCISLPVFIVVGDFLRRIADSFAGNSLIGNISTSNRVFLFAGSIAIFSVSYSGKEMEVINSGWREDHAHYNTIRLRSQYIFSKMYLSVPNLDKSVIFNCRELDEVPAMFITGVPCASMYMPDHAVVSRLKQNGYRVVVMDNFNLPEWIRNDSSIVKFRSGYWKI